MAEPAVRAIGLTKTYGSGPAAVPVLRGAEISVEPGEFVSILGPSGSGKSTLLNVLGLMDRPDFGTLTLGGQDARAALRNEKLGFVFQFDSLLPEFTILENVMMPARIAKARGAAEPKLSVETRVRAILTSLGIDKLAQRRPAQTSGGERQRAAIARALVNRPSLILADEPTGNLDRENGVRVFADFRRIAREQQAAVVMVTHDEHNARSTDRVLRMSDGVLTHDPA
jgi:lipoprotein-releasing system ATP-binding protein